MMKRYVASLIACLVFLAARYPTTLSAQSPPSTTSYLSLLSDGFEVKSVDFIFNDASWDLGHSLPAGTVVTLQKGGGTARCWITFATYANGDTRDRQGGLLPMNCYLN